MSGIVGAPPLPERPRRSHAAHARHRYGLRPGPGALPAPSVLLVSDLAYEARGRRYCDEDIHLSSRLRETFDVALCHPRDAAALLERFDLALVRNSGPVLHYREAYDAFRARALELGTPVYNPLDGRGDMAGKEYLVAMDRAGLPVIPTVDRADDLARLPGVPQYALKPKLGGGLGRAAVRHGG